MLTQYIKNPRTVKGLANEIKLLVDDYWSRKIPENVAKEFVLYWAKEEGVKLFQGSLLNPTIRKEIGKKRTELINKWLEGTQYSLFI